MDEHGVSGTWADTQNGRPRDSPRQTCRPQAAMKQAAERRETAAAGLTHIGPGRGRHPPPLPPARPCPSRSRPAPAPPPGGCSARPSAPPWPLQPHPAARPARPAAAGRTPGSAAQPGRPAAAVAAGHVCTRGVHTHTMDRGGAPSFRTCQWRGGLREEGRGKRTKGWSSHGMPGRQIHQRVTPDVGRVKALPACLAAGPIRVCSPGGQHPNPTAAVRGAACACSWRGTGAMAMHAAHRASAGGRPEEPPCPSAYLQCAHVNASSQPLQAPLLPSHRLRLPRQPCRVAPTLPSLPPAGRGLAALALGGPRGRWGRTASELAGSGDSGGSRLGAGFPGRAVVVAVAAVQEVVTAVVAVVNGVLHGRVIAFVTVAAVAAYRSGTHTPSCARAAACRRRASPSCAMQLQSPRGDEVVTAVVVVLILAGPRAGAAAVGCGASATAAATARSSHALALLPRRAQARAWAEAFLPPLFPDWGAIGALCGAIVAAVIVGVHLGHPAAAWRRRPSIAAGGSAGSRRARPVRIWERLQGGGTAHTRMCIRGQSSAACCC